MNLDTSPIVDLHQHVIPDFYWKASNEDGDAAGGITPPRWSLDGAIAYLDKARIDAAVPSISTPGVHFGDDAAARLLAHQVNEYLAGLKHDRPDRFGGFGILPLPDVEGSLEQIAYALDVLELDGVSMLTNAGGSYLGADVKYLFSHAGGTIPYLASRFAIVDEMDVIPGAAERGAFADTLPRLHWDTASAFSDPVLRMLRSVTGLGNVVFGTDYPYPRNDISIGGLRALQETAELRDEERRAVLGGSAGRLIPRFARVASTL
jgi:predicted TIM-barrel fold metal-dependent hydrolase